MISETVPSYLVVLFQIVCEDSHFFRNNTILSRKNIHFVILFGISVFFLIFSLFFSQKVLPLDTRVTTLSTTGMKSEATCPQNFQKSPPPLSKGSGDSYSPSTIHYPPSTIHYPHSLSSRKYPVSSCPFVQQINLIQ